MKVRILAFGIARELCGAREFEMEIPEASTVIEFKNLLFEQKPGFLAVASITIAVNAEYSEDTHVLGANDEIAIIPPVSGG
ncbi:MAG: MoaD/ThiS family protein [Saprospiraceae bacterium]|nr:MoaD/ThiS family protein [Saprospiraceae bacterium]